MISSYYIIPEFNLDKDNKENNTNFSNIKEDTKENVKQDQDKINNTASSEIAFDDIIN